MTAATAAMLTEMAELAGIHTTYQDAYHRRVDISPDAAESLLAALGFPTSSSAEATASLKRLNARWQTALPRLIVTNAGEPRHVALRPGFAAPRWRLEHEDGGEIASGPDEPDKNREHLILPGLPAGYHRLVIDSDIEPVSTVIAAPPACWRPDGDLRIWGVSTPPYSLRSERDFGIGDFTDIKSAAEILAARGVSFLALNPMHALFASNREWISPYSPSSRLFVDPIYIDPMAVPGLEAEAKELADELGVLNRAGDLRDSELVDYAGVWRLKRDLLWQLWQRFATKARSPDFEAFKASGAPTLDRHARFEAAAELTNDSDPDSNLVAFHSWLQWIAETQLREAQFAALEAGMPLGLFADLAVGASPDGSEVASDPDQYIAGAAIGAPPDLLAPQGQNWGLRAMSPTALEETGLVAFRRLIAANMRHASGIRIDHAFQLSRLYLIADGRPASDGAYLTYPAEALFASLRIESHRAKCVVVGEEPWHAAGWICTIAVRIRGLFIPGALFRTRRSRIAPAPGRLSPGCSCRRQYSRSGDV